MVYLVCSFLSVTLPMETNKTKTKQTREDKERRRDRGGGWEEVVKTVSEVARLFISSGKTAGESGRAGN